MIVTCAWWWGLVGVGGSVGLFPASPIWRQTLLPSVREHRSPENTGEHIWKGGVSRKPMFSTYCSTGNLPEDCPGSLPCSLNSFTFWAWRVPGTDHLLYTAVLYTWLQFRSFQALFLQRYNSLCFQSFSNSSEWQAHYYIPRKLSSFIIDSNVYEIPFLSSLMIFLWEVHRRVLSLLSWSNFLLYSLKKLSCQIKLQLFFLSW